ncbi:MAG: hypothetical protein Q4C65_10320 [Eubacteriales bacterium]|nr:hypothetical protein [Eubacteriales bacterium]
MTTTEIKEIIFQNDPYGMDWLRPDFSYAQTKCPAYLTAHASHIREGDRIFTTIELTNAGDKPYFSHVGDIAVAFPLQDKYEDSRTCLKKRCHTHLFMGGNVSYIMALRMGGEAPHLGMVLTEGSLSAYSIERDIAKMSNDRGCFWLHPSAMEFAPGETKRISWTVFSHTGRTDFYEKLEELSRFVRVEAGRYVLFEGEKTTVTVTPAFPAERVLVNGQELAPGADGSYVFEVQGDCYGEKLFWIEADQVKTNCRLFVQKRLEELAPARCRFLARRQQYTGAGSALDGAYLAWDNEEDTHVYTPENDYNGGRERICMGILTARYLQRPDAEDREELEAGLRRYVAYVKRELVDEKTGKTCNDIGMDDSYERQYNLPWAMEFFCELYRLFGDREDLLTACRIGKQFYGAGGRDFYSIELPIELLDECLEKAGLAEEREQMRRLFVEHADRICERGLDYPAFEVNYEQSIVAPAADVLLKVYLLTGEEKYLEEGKRQLEVLELFNGCAPDYHLYETAIRHWDGYWFGKRKLYGDTFPHYWSALTGNVFELYGRITGDETYRKRAEDSRRGVLPMIFADGRASCAFVFPWSINGVRAHFYDPYANDQDWGLYFSLRARDSIRRDEDEAFYADYRIQ